ncbi:cation diffusion facilitator family transporter [Acidihalobacter ferrooxydans]|uniref:Cation-efflux pump n=1 Tax=Acidihalobacter ferrooxydans TaxID=1765967 RepID=A0A1P8UDQ7_9GAMM|nr:cation diffusion facilitator family transporter [Acidihalobacter ferrooxydans]APZ41919.1 cation-efflux pump [Acidihalobacter ferrooxydans]
MSEQKVSDADVRYAAMRRVTLVGATVNVVVSVAQIAGGVFAQSQALIADGLHTLSDLISDAVVLFAAKHGSQDADEDHPYGHRRIETLGSVFVGLALLGVALGIGYSAGERLLHPATLSNPEPLALAFAALAIVAKESLYHYTVYVARRVRSNLLRANAWHHRSDVFSSLVVFAGIGGALLGFRYLDAVAALVVAVMIVRIGWQLATSGVRELVDTALDPEDVAKLRQAILDTDGVSGLHMLRTRRMGGEALADVHILVNSRISVSEGHRISEAVEQRLLSEFEEMKDVIVHIDPEDDEREAACATLPQRSELLARLREQWADIPIARRLENVGLHYLNGHVHIELFVPLREAPELEEAKTFARELKAACKRVPEVGEVTVYFRCGGA